MRKTTTVAYIGVFCFVTLLSISNTFGQSRGLTSRQASSIDIIGGADIGFRILGLSPTASDSTVLQNRKLYEAPKIGYRFGLNYILGISKSTALKIGFRYANAGFKISKIESINVEQDIDQIRKIDAQRALKYSGYTYNYRFIEIPLGFRFTRVHAFCQPFIEIGMSGYIYNSTKIKEDNYELETKMRVREMVITSSNTHAVKENISTINLLPYLSTGGNFRITENLSGFSQFIIRKQINDLRIGKVIEKLIILGGEIGVRYYLTPY